MTEKKATKARLVGGLAFALVAVFVAFVAYHTWFGATPVVETPVGETPVGETPVAEAPAVETQEVETPVAEPASTTDCTDISNLAADHALIGLKGGCVEIAFRPDLAPNHVARIKELASEGFYDGIVFHRVIDGFMAQTGDPTGTGAGGSDLPDLEAEFSDAHFARGTLGMARTSDPNSANSQFFITYADAAHLDGQYTVFGEVVDGMDLVDNIKKGNPSQNGLVSDPDAMITFRVSDK